MFVRAFDPHTKQYYKSMVYALLDSGCFEQAVLYHPGLDSFVLLYHLAPGSMAPQYEAIQSDRAGWKRPPSRCAAPPTRRCGTMFAPRPTPTA